MALGGAFGLGLVARDSAAFYVAGAAQTRILRRFAWQERQKLTSTIFMRNFVTHIHKYMHIHIQIRTYVHAYYLFTDFHTQAFTTSFVFPSFPVPATTFEAQYWKKLTGEIIRSFIFLSKNTNMNTSITAQFTRYSSKR